MNPDEPRRRTCAAAVAYVLEDCGRLLDWKPETLDRRTLPLGEDPLAGLAVDHPDGATMSAPPSKAEVPMVTPSSVRTALDLTAEVLDRTLMSETLFVYDRLRNHGRGSFRVS